MARKAAMEELDRLFKQRWKDEFIRINGNFEHLPTVKYGSRTRLIVPDEECGWRVEEQCAKCLEYRPVTPLWYEPDYHKKTIEEYLAFYQPGCEALCNSKAKPCKECMRNRSGEAYFRRLASLYKQIPLSWFVETYENLMTGPITGIPKKYILAQANQFLCVSVHDMARLHRKEYGTKLKQETHQSETCCLDLFIANVQQLDRVDDLTQAWLAMYQYAIFIADHPHEYQNSVDSNISFHRKWYENSPKENGVTANRSKTPLLYKSQTQQFHLPAIFTRMASRQRDLDRRDRDTVGKNNGREYAKVFFENNTKCAITGIPLSIRKNLWTDVTFDRIDNTRPHDTTNVRPVIWLLQITARNVEHVLTAKSFAHMVLIQQRIPISHESIPYKYWHERHESLENEHCNFCQIEPLQN